MPNRPDLAASPLGTYDKSRNDRMITFEVIAFAMTLIWLALTAVVFLVLEPRGAFTLPGGGLYSIMILMAVLMPIALIWVMASAARNSRVMRDENQRLQAAVDSLRQAYIAENQSHSKFNDPSMAKKLDEIAAVLGKTESALAELSSSRPIAPPPDLAPENDDQVDLPLGTRAEDMHTPLERPDFIRALNFPETAEDKAGFASLRRALCDRPTSQLIRAAQDVLTLISQDGIYMDDLRPDVADPEIWRRFAGGERGQGMAALGGVRDRTSLALTGARMRADPIFRDAAHHFLRLFDRMFTKFSETATDAEISDLSNTRTARAFMLLGRVAGTFN